MFEATPEISAWFPPPGIFGTQLREMEPQYTQESDEEEPAAEEVPVTATDDEAESLPWYLHRFAIGSASALMSMLLFWLYHDDQKTGREHIKSFVGLLLGWCSSTTYMMYGLRKKPRPPWRRRRRRNQNRQGQAEARALNQELERLRALVSQQSITQQGAPPFGAPGLPPPTGMSSPLQHPGAHAQHPGPSQLQALLNFGQGGGGTPNSFKGTRLQATMPPCRQTQF